MRRMHRIAEQHGFIVANLVQQDLVLLDEGGLPVGVPLARHSFRIAMRHAQPMQPSDQTRAALMGDAELLLDPGANRAGGPRQRLGDPRLQASCCSLRRHALPS